MTKNRYNIEQDLERLEGYAMALARKYPDARTFWQEFSGLAEEVMRNASQEDYGWVLQRVREIVLRAGVEGPPPA